MKKIKQICFFIYVCTYLQMFSQIPVGFSFESITTPIRDNDSPYPFLNQYVAYYKASNYNPITSPLVFVNHGVGGTGFGACNDFKTIADRRGALVVGIYFDSISGSLSHQGAETYPTPIDTNYSCDIKLPPTSVLKTIYRTVLAHENRSEIPTYMIGFSAGGQFANRYNVHRQIYPDSIPFRMIVSSSAYAYLFPTDTLNGEHLYGYFGFGASQDQFFPCDEYSYLFNNRCETHIAEYYQSNYGILIGTADNAFLAEYVQGDNRYERAYNLYHFGLEDAQQQGLEFNWHYEEIPGIGHDTYGMYNTFRNPEDTSSIAETLLFDTPYVEPIEKAPYASFKVGEKLGSSVSFINTSNIFANSYYWDFGDGHISTEENPTHLYTVPGTFTVQLTVTNNGACKNWIFLLNVVEITLEDIASNSLYENQENFLKIYPNPSNGIFLIENQINEPFEIKVYNSFGQEVECIVSYLTKNKFQIEINQKGIFYLEYINLKGKLIKKLLSF
ncbi:MAG: PKD domain-containing protein [Flavobacteriia bacterium]|nr:PKD domain-containing protein [Flavobacteriia bacterium]